MPIHKTKPSARNGSAGKLRTGSVAKRAAVLLIEAGGASRKDKPVSIAVHPKTLKTLAGQPSQMTALIETYGAALERSRLIGRAVSFVVDVGPRGEPKFRPLEGQAQKAAEPMVPEPAGNLQMALAAARSRGRAQVADILGGADMLSANEFAALIGTSRVTVNSKRQNHQVLGLEGAKRGFRFPEWQLGEDGKPFPALPELFNRLGSPWAVYRFLVQHHPELNGATGRDALYQGRSTEALEVAESVLRAAS